MPTAGPEEIVARPPLLPPVTGLLQVAAVVDHSTADTDYAIGDPDGGDRDHWLAGIRWAPASNKAVVATDPCGAGFSAPGSTHPSPIAYYPFALVEEDTCSPWSFRQADFVAYATEGIKAREWGALEAEFERGVLNPANPHLADAASPTLAYLATSGGTAETNALALSPKDALAALDEAIANWGGGLGMIHAPAYVIAQWVAARSVTVVEPPADDVMPLRHPILSSPKGNPIVAGNGYRGAAPTAGIDATHAAQWAYATDMVTVHRDDAVTMMPGDIAQALNRQNNLITYRAWRVYALAWSRLLHAAVKVNTVLAAAP